MLVTSIDIPRNKNNNKEEYEKEITHVSKSGVKLIEKLMSVKVELKKLHSSLDNKKDEKYVKELIYDKYTGEEYNLFRFYINLITKDTYSFIVGLGEDTLMDLFKRIERLVKKSSKYLSDNNIDILRKFPVDSPIAKLFIEIKNTGNKQIKVCEDKAKLYTLFLVIDQSLKHIHISKPYVDFLIKNNTGEVLVKCNMYCKMLMKQNPNCEVENLCKEFKQLFKEMKKLSDKVVKKLLSSAGLSSLDNTHIDGYPRL